MIDDPGISWQYEVKDVLYVSPSPLDPEWRRGAFMVPETFYEGLKDLHKIFWGTKKKCKNKNLR